MSRKKNKLVGTSFDDVLMGTDAKNVVKAKGGNDIITTYGGNDKIKAGSGDDIITTYGGKDKIWAGSGDDIITSGEGKDKVWGGAGADLFVTESDASGHVKIMDFEAADRIQFCGCRGTNLVQRGDDVWVIKGDDVKAVVKNFDADDLNIDYVTRLITVATDSLA